MSSPHAWFAAASRIAEYQSQLCAFKAVLHDDGWRFCFGTPDAHDLITWNGISSDTPITRIYTVEADEHAFELRFDPDTPEWRMHISGDIGGDGIVVELCADSSNMPNPPCVILSPRDGARVKRNTLVWDDATITVACDSGTCELTSDGISLIPAPEGKERAGNQSMASRFSFFSARMSVIR
jgi:hypothetical protein